MNFCLPSSGIAPVTGSGGEAYSAMLAADLLAAGHDPHILLAEGKPYGTSLRGHVEPVWPRRGLRWPVMPFAMTPAIWRCWRRHRFDLLASHSVRYTGPACLIGRRLTGRPVVLHAHHLEGDPWTRLLDVRCFQAADCVIADSEFVRGQLRAAGVPNALIRLVYCGAPEWALRLGAERIVPPASEPLIILAVGPLIARKRVRILLHAYAEISPSLRRRTRLVVVGAGPELLPLTMESLRLGIGHQVSFCGFLGEAEKRQWYERASLFVHASVLEGFPLAVLEAMAAGLPVVALDAASMGELVSDGRTGYLVRGPRHMAVRLARLLGVPDRRVAMGREAHERVRDQFAWTETVARVGALYRERAKR